MSEETPHPSLSVREALSAGWGMALGGAIVGLAGGTLLGLLAVSATTTGIAAVHGYEMRGAEMLAGGLIVLGTTVVLALAGVALLLQLPWAPWVAFALAGLHLVGLGLGQSGSPGARPARILVAFVLVPLACLPLPLGAFRRWFEQRRGEALALDRRTTWAIGGWTGAMLSLAGAIGGPMKRMRDEVGLSSTWLEDLAFSLTSPFQDYGHVLFPVLLLAGAACLRLPAERRQAAFLIAAIGGSLVWAACLYGLVVSPLWRLAQAL